MNLNTKSSHPRPRPLSPCQPSCRCSWKSGTRSASHAAGSFYLEINRSRAAVRSLPSKAHDPSSAEPETEVRTWPSFAIRAARRVLRRVSCCPTRTLSPKVSSFLQQASTWTKDSVSWASCPFSTSTAWTRWCWRLIIWWPRWSWWAVLIWSWCVNWSKSTRWPRPLWCLRSLSCWPSRLWWPDTILARFVISSVVLLPSVRNTFNPFTSGFLWTWDKGKDNRVERDPNWPCFTSYGMTETTSAVVIQTPEHAAPGKKKKKEYGQIDRLISSFNRIHRCLGAQYRV